MSFGYGPAGSDREAATGFSEAPPRRRPLLAPLLALLVVLLFAGGIWYAYRAGRSDSTGPVPLIRADKSAAKIRPAQPGGMTIPDQDKLVYGEADATKVEKLLPPPETPLPAPVAPPPPPAPATAAAVPAMPAPPPTAPAVTPTASTPVAAAPMAAAPAPAPTAPPVASAPERATPQAKPEPPATPAAKAPAASKPAKAGTGGYRLQLAAVRSEAAARRAWSKISAAQKDLLGGLDAEWPRADLGKRGIWYRVQAGPISDGGKAEHICEELKHRHVACFLVRP